MAFSEQQHDIAIRRQIFLEGLKESEARKYEKFLKKIDRELRHRLSKTDLTEFGRGRLNTELKEVNLILDGIYSEWEDEFNLDLIDIAESEAAFEVKTLDLVTPKGIDFATPTVDRLATAINTQPLSVKGVSNGRLLKPFIKDFTATQKKHISGAIRQGYYEGKTNAEILRTIRGTRKNRFKDGILEISRNQAKAVTRTAIQHTASVGRFETWGANDDIIEGYKWVSTLDSRTSTICRSLDGQIFKLNAGPIPPIHIGCRSTTIAEFKDDLKFLQEGRQRASFEGQVDADQDYYTWLKTQPVAFQDAALGKSRAKLFRGGGLTSKQFSDLNIGRDFRPLTLEEMNKLNPAAFEKAEVVPVAV